MSRSQLSLPLTSRAFAPLLLAGAMVLVPLGCTGTQPGMASLRPPDAPAVFDHVAIVTVHHRGLPVHTAASAEAPEAGFAGPGDQLEVVAREGEWLLVELPNQVRGYVREESLFPRECIENRPEPVIVQEPVLKFWENRPRGVVTIEGTYDEQGTLVAHEIIENSVGPVHAERALEDLKMFRFLPPTLDCEPRPFFYTFTRQF